MKTANIEIREMIRKSGVLYWQVAEKIGIADTTFSRKLRHELSNREKTKIGLAVEILKKENEQSEE